jgi:hypothetical protein
VPYNRIKPSENDTPEHAALALRAARESMVLLKNDGVLPLQKGALHRVAVIGPNASSVPVLVGNYNGSPSKPVTVLDGLKAALEPGVQVDYAHGCDYAARPDIVRPIPNIWYRGEYFANRELSGPPAAKRTERPLSFDFCTCHPSHRNHLPPGVPEKDISVALERRDAHDAGGRLRADGAGSRRVPPQARRRDGHRLLDARPRRGGLGETGQRHAFGFRTTRPFPSSWSMSRATAREDIARMEDAGCATRARPRRSRRRRTPT